MPTGLPSQMPTKAPTEAPSLVRFVAFHTRSGGKGKGSHGAICAPGRPPPGHPRLARPNFPPCRPLRLPPRYVREYEKKYRGSRLHSRRHVDVVGHRPPEARRSLETSCFPGEMILDARPTILVPATLLFHEKAPTLSPTLPPTRTPTFRPSLVSGSDGSVRGREEQHGAEEGRGEREVTPP